jgi:hypothetical protein
MNIVFQISGGIGKCIASTAVCKAIKTQYPQSNLIVISGYPDVYLGNPNVDKAYGFNSTPYFYTDHIEGKDIKIMAHDPYLSTPHILQNEHLIKTWCEMFDIEYNGEQPEMFLTNREKTFYGRQYESDKPIMVLQSNGGGESDLKYSWARDIPSHVVVEVIEAFKDDYAIAHVRRDDQLSYDNTFHVQNNVRALSVLIEKSSKRLLMDSFAQHMSAAYSKPSTVLWIANKPEVFGYDIHTNIVSNPFTIKPELRNSYLSKFNIGGDLLEFPYNDEFEIFNVEDIIQSLRK